MTYTGTLTGVYHERGSGIAVLTIDRRPFSVEAGPLFRSGAPLTLGRTVTVEVDPTTGVVTIITPQHDLWEVTTDRGRDRDHLKEDQGR